MDPNNNSANLARSAETLKEEISQLQDKLVEFEKKQKTLAEESAPIKTLYVWEAPERVFVAKSSWWYTIMSLVMMLAIAFAALTRDILLIIVLIVVGVLVYLSSTIKPRILVHEITNKGIKSGNNLWQWRSIEGFWYSRRNGQQLVILDLYEKKTTNRIMLLLGTGNPEKILKTLMEHIPYFTRKQIGEDLIASFTYGDYVPLTEYINTDKDVQKARK